MKITALVKKNNYKMTWATLDQFSDLEDFHQLKQDKR